MPIHTMRLGAIAVIATIASLPAQGGRQLFETHGNGFSRGGGHGAAGYPVIETSDAATITVGN